MSSCSRWCGVRRGWPVADLERQYELAMLLDCELAFGRLIRISGLDEAGIDRRAHMLVVMPEGVREAYRPAYRRGMAIVALAAANCAGDEIGPVRDEVLRLLDFMKRGGL